MDKQPLIIEQRIRYKLRCSLFNISSGANR